VSVTLAVDFSNFDVKLLGSFGTGAGATGGAQNRFLGIFGGGVEAKGGIFTGRISDLLGDANTLTFLAANGKGIAANVTLPDGAKLGDILGGRIPNGAAFEAGPSFGAGVVFGLIREKTREILDVKKLLRRLFDSTVPLVDPQSLREFFGGDREKSRQDSRREEENASGGLGTFLDDRFNASNR